MFTGRFSIMNDIEQEAIILNSAYTMIDDMVNWTMFPDTELTGSTVLQFNSREHARLFIILLTDFLSHVRDSKAGSTAHKLRSVPTDAQGADRTFIYYLRQVCRHPQLGTDPANLDLNVEQFADWLEELITSEGVNLPSISAVTDVTVKRLQYIKLCGNIAKHNLSRLDQTISDLRRLLEEAGHDVSVQEAYLATENFFDWFFHDIFIFHSNQIIEFLNDIRWAMYIYLQPEYRRSWHSTGGFHGGYGYHVPDAITDPVARAMYWDLMNSVRSKPFLKQFVVHAAFKGPHTTEDGDQT